MIESMDDATGRVMSVLDDLGLADNTLLIFTSDNGGVDAGWNGHPQRFFTHNGPLRAGKCWPYEGGIRVPGIVRWPGRAKAGSVCDEPVTGVDWLPTICEAAGIALPSDRAIDGESIMPLIRQKGGMTREAIYWHYPHYQHQTPNSIVRVGEWKLIRYYEDGKRELFNLKDDLSEERDLADSKPEIVKRLGAMLDKWINDTGAKLPISNPAYSGRDSM
jgi:arylsulfatase A-like enzyme